MAHIAGKYRGNPRDIRSLDQNGKLHGLCTYHQGYSNYLHYTWTGKHGQAHGLAEYYNVGHRKNEAGYLKIGISVHYKNNKDFGSIIRYQYGTYMEGMGSSEIVVEAPVDENGRRHGKEVWSDGKMEIQCPMWGITHWQHGNIQGLNEWYHVVDNTKVRSLYFKMTRRFGSHLKYSYE